MDHPLAAFDIETIPDPELGRRLFGLEGTDGEVVRGMLARRREETGERSDFYQPPFHRIVAISVAWLYPDSGRFRLGTPGGPTLDETAHLRAFFGIFRVAKPPRLVSWNGHGFDLPVIRYRSMLRGVAAPLLYEREDEWRWNNYQNRFHDMHVDLMDVLSGYGTSSRVRLDDFCRIVGLPGKTLTAGERVHEHVAAGEDDLVRTYCELDALNTLLLYLLWRFHTGHLEAIILKDYVAAITRELAAEEAKPAWREFAEQLRGWPAWGPPQTRLF